jgi:tetratricopeptide (TPR) repeat protein
MLPADYIGEAEKLSDRGRPQDARRMLEAGLVVARRAPGPEGNGATAVILSSLAGYERDGGNPVKALKYAREAVALLPSWARAIWRAEARNQEGLALHSLGINGPKPLQANLDQAEASFRQALEILAPGRDKSHLKLVWTVRNNLARTLAATGRPEEAKALYLETLRDLGEKPSEIGGAINNNLASIAMGQSKPDLKQVFAYFRESLRHFEGVYGKMHPYVGDVLLNMGIVAEQGGDLPAAKRHYQRAYELMSPPGAYGPNHPSTIEVRRILTDLGVFPRDPGLKR